MTPASVWASCFSPAAIVLRNLHSANALSNAVWTPDRSWNNVRIQHVCRRHAATALRLCSSKLHVYSISADHSGKAAPKPTNKHTPSRRRHNQPKAQSHKNDAKSNRADIVKQLMRIETQGAYAGLLSGVNPAQDDEDSSKRQSRSVTFTVSNVVRWQRQLDFFISNLTGQPCSKLEPSIHAILRLGVYEVVHQDLAGHVISEHVQLAKSMVRAAAGKLVNAVLRRLLREIEAGTLVRPPMPTPDTPMQEAAEMLAVATSHPTWMVLRWLKRWGQKDTLLLLDHNNRSSLQFGVRVVPGTGLTPTALVEQLHAADRQAAVSEVLPKDFLRVNGLQYLLRNQLLQNGQCQVQDEAAGLVVALLDPHPGEAILDACAAPGGKALYAATRMEAQGSLLALDINANRLGALQTAAAAQGLQSVVATKAADLCELAASAAKEALTGKAEYQYDRVLLDAPCTGLGVLAKRADLRWRRTPEALTQLIELQEKLLDAAASLVKPGGLLVYSTCSIEQEENEDQVSAFLDRHPEFHVEQPDPAVLPAHLVTMHGYFTSLPHLHQMDGAFGARLRRDR